MCNPFVLPDDTVLFERSKSLTRHELMAYIRVLRSKLELNSNVGLGSLKKQRLIELTIVLVDAVHNGNRSMV